MRKTSLCQTLFTAALLLAPVPVWAQPLVQSQEGIALQNEIDQLHQQVQQMQSGGQSSGSSMLGGGAPPAATPESGGPVAGGVVASLLTQVQQLQAQVQTLNGQVDTLQNQVNQQNAQTQKEIGDLNFKVTGSATPGAPAPAAGAAAAQPKASTPPPPAAASDPKTQLHNALDAYGQKNYTSSAALAESLVKASPRAPEAYRAQYLAAQSYAAAGRSQEAAIAYDNTYNMNRSGTYAPQSMLGLATSLAGIGANDEACSTLNSLNSQFPTPPAGMQPRIDAVSKQAHCH